MRTHRKTPRRRWPPEARAYATTLRRAGMVLDDIAQAIALIFGRPCKASTLHEWVRGDPEGPVAHTPWSPGWVTRARNLRQYDGVSAENIAAIITIESRRPCARGTVDGWLGNKPHQTKTAAALAMVSLDQQ